MHVHIPHTSLITKTTMHYRHGDFLFSKVESIEGMPVESKSRFVFGVGEATNHEHALTVKDPLKMKWFKAPDGGWFVDLREEGIATHPEHSLKTDLVIAPGIYRVRQILEKDWFSGAVRRVID